MKKPTCVKDTEVKNDPKEVLRVMLNTPPQPFTPTKEQQSRKVTK